MTEEELGPVLHSLGLLYEVTKQSAQSLAAHLECQKAHQTILAHLRRKEPEPEKVEEPTDG